MEHRTLRTSSLSERIEYISALWLGRPYTDGPLGEAGGHDPEPVLRYDTFDCLTYIEEVLATALAPDPLSVHTVRMGLRYRNGGPYTYENRRHFMLAEWIPGVVEDGWMVNITASFFGIEETVRELTLAHWNYWHARGNFPLDDERFPTGPLGYTYLPAEQALLQASSIPSGSVIFFLRETVDWSPIIVTHVGLVVSGDTPTLRHASKRRGGVYDESLETYIQSQIDWEGWPLEGLIILAPMDYGPRSSTTAEHDVTDSR